MAQGQISIDYIAGAFVFFAAVIILAGDVLLAVPNLQQSQHVDELELVAWSVSETLMGGDGHWSDGTTAGTDWHRHTDNITVLGLRDGSKLSEEKINAFIALSDGEIQDLLDINETFNIELNQVIAVDTSNTFSQGSPPAGVTEPTYPSRTDDTVHYGAHRIQGQSYHFLLANTDGWYNTLYTSTDPDFNTSTQYNLTIDRAILLGSLPYRIPGGSTKISEGNTLILERRMGRVGPRPAESVNTIIRIDRYGAADDYLVEGVFRIWR